MLKSTLKNLTSVSRKSIKSPKGNLVFGHLIQFYQNPLDFLSYCAREYGDLVPLRFGPFPTLLLNHPQLISEAFARQHKQFMRKERFFRLSTKPLLGNGLFLSEGDFYNYQRNSAQPAFHQEMIDSYGEAIVVAAQNLMENWQDGECRNIYEDFVALTLSIITKTFFGTSLEPKESAMITESLDSTMDHFTRQQQTLFLIPQWLPTSDNVRFNRSIKKLDQAVEQIINQRRINEGNKGNFLDLLLKMEKNAENPITQKQLRDEVINLLLAGHETTAIALTWGFWLLSQHSEVEAKLVDELQSNLGGKTPTVADLSKLPYTEAVALEVLRLYPPVWLLSREALEDTEIGGYEVFKGDTIFACQWTVHRDPRFFEEPHIFNPDRWLDGLKQRLPLGAYFPFSLGPRFCLGRSFAMREIVLLLATIAQEFAFKLDPNHRVEIFPSLTLRPKYGMKMSINSRARIA